MSACSIIQRLRKSIIIGTNTPFSDKIQADREGKSGYTVGEYIRNRRLTLAGVELAADNAKVIDVALKYGYESPDSFAKAFQKFHGILPSQAKNQGIRLKCFSHLVLKLSLEGGTIMNHRMETKPKLTLIGYKKHFEGTPYDDRRKKTEYV